MPRLFLRVLSEAQLLEEGEGYALGVEWLIKEADGSVRGTGVTDFRGLSDIADPNVEWLADPDNTVVFLPSQFVLLLSCDVPGRSTAHIRRALPFAVEEFVASDIESMHIAHAPIKPGSPVLCNIISHDVLRGWIECFESIGVRTGAFVVDAQAMPHGAGEASVLFENDTALITTADQAATVDRDTLVFALNSLQAQSVSTINGVLTDVERGQLEGDPHVEELPVSQHGVLDFLADQFSDSACINILQGEYVPNRPASVNASRWAGVAVLAAAWAVIAFFGLIAEGWWSSSEADRLTDDSYALYDSIFPGESQPASTGQLRRRLASKLGTDAGAGGASAFVGLAANFANVTDPAHRLDAMSYADQRQELTVEVRLRSYDELETIKTKLASEGVLVDVASAEEEGGSVRSRMRVRYDQ